MLKILQTTRNSVNPQATKTKIKINGHSLLNVWNSSFYLL